MMPRFHMVSLLLLGSVVVLASQASEAEAQCSPDAWFCAEAHVDVGGSVYVGTRHHRRHHRHHHHHHQHEVVVEPAPPAPPPEPPVVVVEQHAAPAPPPPSPPTEVVERKLELEPPRFGIHAHVAGMSTRHVHMGGIAGALRIRPEPHVAVDLGIGGFGGTDWNGLDRYEIPVTTDVLFFVNPDDPLQVYFLVGAGASFAHAEGRNRHTGRFESRDFLYLGGELGVGLEWRLSRHFALNLDLRGFLRQRIDDNDDRPEFVEYDSRGRATGNVSDTSAGGLLTGGATIYF